MIDHALHTISIGLVRRTWVVVVATCAVLAAHAASSYVEAQWLPERARGAAPLASRAAKVDHRPYRDGVALVERDMFCSTCAASARSPRSTDAFVPDAVLIATAIGRTSTATLWVPHTNALGSWSVGDRVPGIGTITAIEPTEIAVTSVRGELGHIGFASDSAARRGGGAATPDAAAADAPWAARVHRIDDHTIEVDRALLRDVMTGMVKPGGVRVTPVFDPADHTAMVGLRVLGSVNGTLAGALGLVSGDVLATIDGKQIRSAQTLLDAYASFDQLDTVELGLVRQGRPFPMTLRLR